jgi:acetyl-CoA acetyltransferase
MAELTDAEPAAELRDQVAIVGIGETDYALDYRAAREEAEGFIPKGPVELAQLAFERALGDAGLQAGDVDGLSATLMYGGPEPSELAERFGLNLRCVVARDGMSNGILIPVASAVRAVASGACDTMALVYAAPSRSIGRRYGGQTYEGAGRGSYYYYHPWGWSSQAAHWALIAQHYLATYRAEESDFGAIACSVRANAMLNDNAIMREPLTIEGYLQSRYIVRPVHLFDMCLVNDGGVCLIFRRADAASESTHAPVLVSGWGHAEISHSMMHYLVKERLRPQMEQAFDQAMMMAGVGRAEINHFQGYDPSTVQLLNQLEGYGFADVGEGLQLAKEGQLSIGGSLPTNTNGGLLSGAYMHGWNNLVESVRQLRHEAGARQVSDAELSLFSVATMEAVHPVILRRG